MGFFDFFRKSESLIALDIGSSGLKLVQLDVTGVKPALGSIGYVPLPSDAFSGNAITKTELIAGEISSLLDEKGITGKRVVLSMPSPSVFTKKVKMPKMSNAELASNIEYEAGNLIPHDISAVRLDYHVLGEASKSEVAVLLVAVKNEVIESYLEVLSLAGIEPAVVDVDYFALQNMFELGYPELVDKTVALVDIGARFTSINICRSGQSLFTGDVSVGGRMVTEAIMEGTGVSEAEAEKLKRNFKASSQDCVEEIVLKKVDFIASELNRQIGFFWNASESDGGIDHLVLSGGGASLTGIAEMMKEKTGIECTICDPFRGIDVGEGVDANYLKEVSPMLGVSVGLGLRQPGDRLVYEEE